MIRKWCGSWLAHRCRDGLAEAQVFKTEAAAQKWAGL